MMARPQIEARVLRILDSVVANRQAEDRNCELKAEWPSAEKSYATARQLAGHANAARGEPLLWIIGANERGGRVDGASKCDVQAWFAPHRKHFDGDIVPELTDTLVIPFNETSVTVMCFDTTRAPYVIKVPRPQKGQPSSDVEQPDRVPELEVPFRRGNNTYSARRQDLVQILVPVSPQPEIDLLRGEMRIIDTGTSGHITAFAEVYVTVPHGGRVIVPAHRCRIDITVPNADYKISVGRIELKPRETLKRHETTGPTVPPQSQIVVDGAGLMHLWSDDTGVDMTEMRDIDTARMHLPSNGISLLEPSKVPIVQMSVTIAVAGQEYGTTKSSQLRHVFDRWYIAG